MLSKGQKRLKRNSLYKFLSVPNCPEFRNGGKETLREGQWGLKNYYRFGNGKEYRMAIECLQKRCLHYKIITFIDILDRLNS